MKQEKAKSPMSKNDKKNQNPKGEEEEDDESITLDSIIDEFFQYEDQRRRFKSELSNSMNIKVDLEHTSSNLSVIVGVKTSLYDFGSTVTNQELINFEIDISQKYYPQKGTRIYCKTPFLNPCLCDGRDFLQDIMGHPWYNQITFVQIAEQIIEFVKELVKHKIDSLYLQRLGRYFIGHNYKYDDIKQFSSLVRVPCVQFEDNFFLKLHVRIIGITDAHFLVFDAEDSEKKNIKLLFWSDLQSLVEIKRRKDEPTKLTFKWKNYQKQNGTPIYYEQTFQIPEPETVIQQILKKIQKFQRIKIWSNSYMNFGNQWDSKKQMIEQLTQKVYKDEEEIKHKFNIENVQKLIDSYNDVIEHYSSVNDYLADIFLNSLHNLLNRPDVQCLLNYETESIEDSKALKKQNSQNQDIPVEDKTPKSNNSDNLIQQEIKQEEKVEQQIDEVKEQKQQEEEQHKAQIEQKTEEVDDKLNEDQQKGELDTQQQIQPQQEQQEQEKQQNDQEQKDSEPQIEKQENIVQDDASDKVEIETKEVENKEQNEQIEAEKEETSSE